MTVTISDIVGWIESKHHADAIRFEPEYYARRIARADWDKSIIQNIQAANKCSLGTARMIYCSSWGSFQIMGFNLYKNGAFQFSVARFMSDEKWQVNEFRRFLKDNRLTEYTPERLRHDVTARNHFAKVYNGSAEYARLIVQALDYYGVK